jgi:hypothetical protein
MINFKFLAYVVAVDAIFLAMIITGIFFIDSIRRMNAILEQIPFLKKSEKMFTALFAVYTLYFFYFFFTVIITTFTRK